MAQRSAKRAVDAIEAGTALKAAACKGHDEVVKFLLTKGADPNKIMKGGETPLVWAGVVLGPLLLMLIAGAVALVVARRVVEKTADA